MNELLPLIRAEGKDPARLAARIRGRRRDLASVEEGAQKIIGSSRSSWTTPRSGGGYGSTEKR